MAVIVKNPVAFRCKSFAERYKDHEASSLLEEASQLIQELEDDLAQRSLAERAAVPEGMVLVPREPTQKMIMAGSASLKCDVDYTRRPQMPTRQRAARNAYVSMLSAAPTLAGKGGEE